MLGRVAGDRILSVRNVKVRGGANETGVGIKGGPQKHVERPACWIGYSCGWPMYAVSLV